MPSILFVKPGWALEIFQELVSPRGLLYRSTSTCQDPQGGIGPCWSKISFPICHAISPAVGHHEVAAASLVFSAAWRAQVALGIADGELGLAL